MTKTRSTAVLLLLLLAHGLTGCNGAPSPTSPSTVGQGGAPTPTGTTGVRMTGVVFDTAHRRLADARVEVLDGPQAGATAVTDPYGNFTITGVFDDATRFRASKPGYADGTATRNTCPTCNRDVWYVGIALELPAVLPPLTGDYTLTFTADPKCAELPPEVRTRTYTARVVPSSFRPDTSFTVALSGALLRPDYETLHLNVASDYVRGFVGDGHDGDPGLVEEVGTNSYLTLYGELQATVTDPSHIAASITGVVAYCTLSVPMSTASSCGSAAAAVRCEGAHRLSLIRR